MKTVYATPVATLSRTVFFTKQADAQTVADRELVAYGTLNRVETIPVHDSLEDFDGILSDTVRATALSKLTPAERAALGHPDPAPEPVTVQDAAAPAEASAPKSTGGKKATVAPDPSVTT